MKKNSNLHNIFIDTNVFIGAWTNREKDKKCLQYLFSLIGRRLYTSSLCVAQLISVFQKSKTNAEIKNIVSEIIKHTTVLSCDLGDIVASLGDDKADIEDCIQYNISQKMRCAIFVTNNIKDYRIFPNIQVYKPEKIGAIAR